MDNLKHIIGFITAFPKPKNYYSFFFFPCMNYFVVVAQENILQNEKWCLARQFLKTLQREGQL